MAFSNVDVNKLNKSLTSLKSALNTDVLDELLKSFSNNQYFQTRAVDPPKEALEILKNTRYTELKNMLDNYLEVKDLISSYKEKEEAVEEYRKSISREQSKEHPRGSKISNWRSKIKKLKEEMDNIVKNVNAKI